MNVAEHTPPIFVDVDEAKRQLCLSTASIYNLMKAGELRKIKLGRKTVFSQADLSAFAERKIAEASQVAA